MTITETVQVGDIAPIDHREAMALQEAELARTIEMLRSLSGDEWATPTDCPDWDVRAMYLHVLGACEAGASMRENVHQLKAAYAHRRREGGALEAALSSVQVRERIDLDPAQVVERLARIAPKTVRGRARTPAPVRRFAKLAIDGPVHEKWRLGYLIDVIYLRDMWMHRVDVAVATGRSVDLTPNHDGRIVADVVAEWARRHGEPFVLELSGPAGGRYSSGGDSSGAQHLDVDAVEFCRALAGRVSADGLLATVVPF
jgi:uncharacterized protein (TIGR03083 family)